jgi:hypothetical protein
MLLVRESSEYIDSKNYVHQHLPVPAAFLGMGISVV